MKLITFLSVIDADTNVHIINGDETICHGNVKTAYLQIDDDYIHNSEVNYIRLLNNNLLIETVID